MNVVKVIRHWLAEYEKYGTEIRAMIYGKCVKEVRGDSVSEIRGKVNKIVRDDKERRRREGLLR